MGGGHTINGGALRNAAMTSALLAAGYVLPFLGEHASGSRGIVETVAFLSSHEYFHYYLLCTALTVLVMGTVWYGLEVRLDDWRYGLVGVGYGLLAGIVFAVWYVTLGTTIYDFAIAETYVLIVVVLGTALGTIAGLLRYATLAYR
ncbi:hypothetical protein OB905_09920 [Halobacteria archaeon AArc-dxtr1]|nr:hypothetical protein [Halobacteria archaeon AArc-dxtr1]